MSVTLFILTKRHLEEDVCSALQIWQQEQQWKGWCLLAKQLLPASFDALLQLPTDQLREAVCPFSTNTRVALSHRAMSPSCPVAVQRSNLVLLQVSCQLIIWAMRWLLVVHTLI